MSVVRIPRPGEQIPALDGVRGIAILLVMVHHFVVFPVALSDAVVPMVALDRAFVFLANAGWAGVNLFFVLSGFLITGILYESKGSVKRYLRGFYIRRVLRIFPLYYGAVLVMLLVLPLVLPGDGAGVKGLRSAQIWYWSYLQNIALLFGWEGMQSVPMMVTHLWSLAVEEQFYLIWPVVVFLLPRRGVIAVCGAMIVSAFAIRIGMHLLGVNPSMVYRFTLARMDDLAVGALIALAIRDRHDLRQLVRWAWPVGGVSLAVVALLAVQRGQLLSADAWVQMVGFTPVALVSGILVLAAATAHRSTMYYQVMTQPFLRVLGRHSYALYLIHLPVTILLLQYSQLETALPLVAGSSLLRLLFFGGVAFSISMAGALLTWHLWEKHFLKLKDILAPREEPPAPEPVAVGPGAKRAHVLPRVRKARPSEPPGEIETKKAA